MIGSVLDCSLHHSFSIQAILKVAFLSSLKSPGSDFFFHTKHIAYDLFGDVDSFDCEAAGEFYDPGDSKNHDFWALEQAATHKSG